MSESFPGGNRELPLASWASLLGSPAAETTRSRRLAHVGGTAAVAAVVAYLLWRILFTLPEGGANRDVAWCLIAFEALPLLGLVTKLVTLWNIDPPVPAPRPVVGLGGPAGAEPGGGAARVTLLVPTYNEPREVIGPTVAAACALRPAHETWVLDDGDRAWVRELCEAVGARYVSRERHDHAKAGNLNNALRLIAGERDRAPDQRAAEDIVAVLDCDHVPLPSFLTATLGWFDDPEVALVQGPQAFYNQGAFDDDGISGEQGLFFNVVLPARHHAGASPFWCGSTSLLRLSALRQIGGVATETITEDLHTTLKLLRAGWRTVYHHQTLAVGLAPDTPEQYLLQRRRWGMGAMQILVRERLWSAKRWMSWRTYYEFLAGALWWLEGISTVIALAVPVAVLFSGARTSTARPETFAGVFVVMFTVRLWGAKRLLRSQIHWPTAFALRVMRVPVGLACAWWLATRKSLAFAVTPKGGSASRSRGRPPKVLWFLVFSIVTICTYASAGVVGEVPWRTNPSSTVASGMWLAFAGIVLLLGVRRIRSPRYASSRRNAPRIAVNAPVSVDGTSGSLVDVSAGGAAVRLAGELPAPDAPVTLELPGRVRIDMVALPAPPSGREHGVLSLKVAEGDWESLRRLGLWLFHTPSGVVAGLPPGVPVVAATPIGAPDGRASLGAGPVEAEPARWRRPRGVPVGTGAVAVADADAAA